MKIHHILILLAAFLLAACGGNQPSANSPSETLQRYFEASQKGDVAAMKRLLSKGSLELIEKSARLQNTTGDELLRRESEVEIKRAPETRNEKIEGETATVEVKNETTGKFDMKLPFVREDGAWKLARDKYIEEVMRKASEEINRKLSNSSLSNSTSAPNANSGNSAVNK